jgi:hypothetical protein
MTFFQIVSGAASITIKTRLGRTYILERGKPTRVDDEDDAQEIRGNPDVQECDEEGLAPRVAEAAKPLSEVKFQGPKHEPAPKPALKDSKESVDALRRAESAHE